MDNMDITHTLAYKKAFDAYLRRGTPIEWSLKAMAALLERPTTHYIWRTRGDGRVRASHAANNGRIFSWDNPPPMGHPGEDYNCRCTRNLMCVVKASLRSRRMSVIHLITRFSGVVSTF